MTTSNVESDPETLAAVDDLLASAPMDSHLGLFTIIHGKISDIIKYHNTFFTYNCSPRELRNLLKELAQG